jgi:hypothetical protein
MENKDEKKVEKNLKDILKKSSEKIV